MPTKQTNKRAKIKAEAKVNTGATNTPIAESEHAQHRRKSRPRPAAVGTNPTAETAPAARKARLNGSRMVNNKLEEARVPSKPVAERADLATSRVNGAEQPPAGTKRAQLINLLERSEGASVTEMGSGSVGYEMDPERGTAGAAS